MFSLIEAITSPTFSYSGRNKDHIFVSLCELSTAKQIDPDLNVIVITGYPDSEILDRILQVSPVTALKKPLKVEQLNQTVKILVHNGLSWRAEQQNLKPLAGL